MTAAAKKWLWTGFCASILIVLLLSPLASRSPDGLNRVAFDQGFAGKEKKAAYSTPLSGYELKVFGTGALAKAAAGVAGVLVTFGAVWVLGKTLSAGKRKNE